MKGKGEGFGIYEEKWRQSKGEVKEKWRENEGKMKIKEEEKKMQENEEKTKENKRKKGESYDVLGLRRLRAMKLLGVWRHESYDVTWAMAL